MTLFALHAGPTLLALLTGTPIAWIKDQSILFSTLLLSILNLGLFYPFWVQSTLLQKLSAIGTGLAGVRLSLALLPPYIANGNWFVGVLLTTMTACARPFLVDVENWSFTGSLPPQNAIKKRFFALLAYCLFAKFSTNLEAPSIFLVIVIPLLELFDVSYYHWQFLENVCEFFIGHVHWKQVGASPVQQKKPQSPEVQQKKQDAIPSKKNKNKTE